MSVLTRKHRAEQAAGVRDRAAQAAQAAQRAVPAAKSVGSALRQSAGDAASRAKPRVDDVAAWAKPRVDDVAAWAKPQVDSARAWAAPRLERSGMAVQDSIAPAISEAMVSAAQRLDVKPARKRRRWATVLAVTMLLAAAATAATAAVLRRRPAEFGWTDDDTSPDSMTAGPDKPASQRLAEANGSQPEVDVAAEADQRS